jgi:hypothetical protein
MFLNIGDRSFNAQTSRKKQRRNFCWRSGIQTGDEILLDWKLHLACSEKYLLVIISGLQSGKKGEPDRGKW